MVLRNTGLLPEVRWALELPRCVPEEEQRHVFSALAMKSEYTAGINIFWHDWNCTATPGIPLRDNAIDTLMEHYFQTPERFPGMLNISVPSPTYAPLEHKGASQRYRPKRYARPS